MLLLKLQLRVKYNKGCRLHIKRNNVSCQFFSKLKFNM